jgi:hypothetical protein
MDAITIIDCLLDEDLFKRHFKGESWEAWWAFLKALFAIPMTHAELELYRRHTGRLAEPEAPFTEAAVVVGRRGGKSRTLALIATFLATCRSYDEYLAPGEVATIGIISTDRKQARTIYRYILGLIQHVPMLTALLEDANNEQIVLRTRVVIEITTASFRTARGYSFAALLCDEIAFWRSDETSANPDVEILRALRPGMASIPGSILLLASSPYAKRGELYNSYRKHFGKDQARVLVWKGSTAQMNPRIDKAVIEEAYLDDPEAARAEYGAEFRDDLADYVPREVVEAVTMWGRSDLPPEEGVSYSAFCDPSGGISDAMTLAIGHLGPQAVCVLDRVLEVRPPFDPEAAVAQCAALLRQYQVLSLTGDHYAGNWPVARFAEHGVSFVQCARPKSDLYRDLLPLLNARRVELLDSTRLMRELTSLERKTARSGRDSIDHIPGGHDDVANAVAGCLVQLDLDRRPALTSSAVVNPARLVPVPLPTVAQWVASVTSVDKAGVAASVYLGQPFVANGEPPLLLLDFSRAPMGGTLFGDVATRLSQLADLTRAHGVAAFVPPELLAHAEAAGLFAEPLPMDVQVEDLLLSVAAHTSAGKLVICDLAREKAATLPLFSALDLRAADAADDALRQAVIWGVALALDGVEAPPHHGAGQARPQ